MMLVYRRWPRAALVTGALAGHAIAAPTVTDLQPTVEELTTPTAIVCTDVLATSNEALDDAMSALHDHPHMMSPIMPTHDHPFISSP